MPKIRFYLKNALSTNRSLPFINLGDTGTSHLFLNGCKIPVFFDLQRGFYFVIEVNDINKGILFGKQPLIISNLIDTDLVVKVTCKFSIRENETPVTTDGNYLFEEKLVLTAKKDQFPQNNSVHYSLEVDSVKEFNNVIQAFWNGDLVHKETKKTTLELLKENNSELNKKMEYLKNENLDLREQLTKYTTTIFYRSWATSEYMFISALKKGLEKLKNVKFSKRK